MIGDPLQLTFISLYFVKGQIKNKSFKPINEMHNYLEKRFDVDSDSIAQPV